MRWVRTLHKWLGLLIGVQMLLWLVSGLVMSMLDADAVSGADAAAFRHEVELLPADVRIVEPAELLTRDAAHDAHELELTRRDGAWVWSVRGPHGATLFDASSGAPHAITAERALDIARSAYRGPGTAQAPLLMQQPDLETRGHIPPFWRVDFGDDADTRYYISASDGSILERRNDAWRVFDFFWMLHTMDYRGRDDFNHPLVASVAFFTLWLAVSGVLLLWRSFRR